MKTSKLVPALLAGFLTGGACVAQPTAAPTSVAKAGLWETTVVIENAAASSKRSVVGRTCVAAADASDLAHIVPAQREFGMQCENRDIKREGASIVWVISCKSKDATQTGKGKMSLFGDSYLGTAEIELRKQGAKPVKLTQSFSGKWLKACS
jgi:hypothetical protein